MILTKIKEDIKKHKNLCYMLIFLVFIIVLPLWRQGIMCNDELQTRFWAYQGLEKAYMHFLKVHAEKGRALSTIVVSFTMLLGFIGQSTWIFKILQIASIILCAGLFTILTFIILKNKRFCVFFGLCLLLFLPISFEHTSPNAFSTLYNIPLSILFLSMILFVKYIANGKRKQLVISMVLLFLAEISYEAFVMYVPLYCLFAILQKGINKDNLKTILMPIANALIFLVLYMLCSKLFPSNYTGNQIQIINIKNSLKIIAELFKSTLPGRYLFSAKYRYLFEIYHKNDWHNIIRECVLAIFVIIILRKLITMKLLNDRKSAVKSLLLVLLFGTAGAILPTIPVSISSMYQNSIGENGFLALPVTFFGYFWSVFLVCYIIWQITAIFKSSVVRDVVIILCMMIIIPIQMMNDTFADEEYSNFVRLETIESFIKSATIKKFDGNTFYCPDLYEIKNALAIHDGYWTDYANATGLDMSFKNEIDNNPNYIYIYIINDDIFEILTDSNLIIMSKNRIGSPVVAKINNDDYAVIECNEYDNDETDWYVYTFERSIVRR